MLDAFASTVATIVNGIRAHGEKLEEISVVRRFLRAAPPRYISVVSAIEQCVDLKTLTMDDLVGRFKAHDERMKITCGGAESDEHVMLTRAQWKEVVAKEKKGDKSSGSSSSRRAKKYIAKEDDEEDDDEAPPRRKKFDIKKVRCHKCGERGHFKSDCPKPPKQKALMAQEGDDGPMLMLGVCELKDEEELPPPAPATEDHVDPVHDGFLVGKQRSAPFPQEATFRASEVMELVDGDICGPISPVTPSGNEFFMLVVDDFSQYMWIVLLKSKDQAQQAFEKIKEAEEDKASWFGAWEPKSLRIARGGEYETVVAMAESMMKSKGLPGKFWGEAVNH